jgi:formylglycine-generating enzyme required for sulfatase activity
MVVVPPGRFMMGSPDTEKDRNTDEGPVHEVRISYAFAVGKYAITRSEWKQFVRETGQKDHSNCLAGQHDNYTVLCVTWHDAQDYAAWLSGKSRRHYRLLSEAEYEYVNRAGSQTAFLWGETEDEMHVYTAEQRNPGDVKWGRPVVRFKPNAFGLYDTTGNIGSWTQDCWHENYIGAPTDGSAWETGDHCSERVWRGGLWTSEPRGLRSAAREYMFESRILVIGFRLASTD